MFELSSQLEESDTKYKPMFFIVLLVLLGITYYEIVRYNNSATELVFNTTEAPTEVFVDVSGAVVSPGVYTISSNSRLGDVLGLAGGVSMDANLQWVTTHLNLSEKITDEQKIYIPYSWENGSEIASVTTLEYSKEQESNLININTDSIEELTQIPGIGEVYAEKIIEGRPYDQLSDLEEKGGLSKSLVQKVTPYVTL